MDRIIIAIAIALALLFAGATGVNKAIGAAAPQNDTIVTVGLVKEMTGARPSATLAWGSYTFPITLKTNGVASRLTVRPTALTNGLGVSLADVRISFSAPAAYTTTGNRITRSRKTAKTGDVVWVTVSVWQPIGSPQVALAYTYEALDAKGVWR